ncbi:NAD(P)/FAD-dependent oxidoreductase [Mucilaginibacter paludis]|uniref:NADH:ubiquinone reductase (non-electrogenic) n=1 Tax=Mucilaginibacter paludis DSM 18603 TaxID=714943 RepID=H1Y5D3_9SPHI|nr:NAD(P)/FAD-dependent oxidoreductase [Mucilaginibacter paludis]EHQ28944.1 FAD-dependent pyridine nucleotide-disulfide oxidoreductase [Mucilaginibacter paludis DSM 18603]
MHLNEITNHPRVVIIGGGFGGIELAKSLKNKPVEVLMVDKNNYHTFQPMLYQVAMGDIEADSIAFPLRKIFTGQKNFTFRMANVERINPEKNTISTDIGDIAYDYAVIATGSTTNYFGNDELEKRTMPMKNIPEALNLRSLILQNVEKALICEDEVERDALLTFVVVGGGPTGVELSGALAEMRNYVLTYDYPELDKKDMKVYLVEGKSEVLAVMSPQASKKAKEYLTGLNVEVHNSVHVKSYNGCDLVIDDGTTIQTRNVLWAAGVKGEVLKGIPEGVIVRGNRIQTDEFNRIKGYINLFAIGDVAAVITPETPEGHPGVAPAAMQQGKQVGKNLLKIIKGEQPEPFKYFDKGSLATIGKNLAVADLGKIHLQGFFAWVIWGFVHLMSLVSARNRIIVFINWAGSYFSHNSGSRLIIRKFDSESMKIK